MAYDFIEQQRRRWLRPAALWLRPDAARFLRPDISSRNTWIDPRWDPLGAAEQKYNPNQPRVPAGNPDGGQWTDGTGAIVLPDIVVSADDAGFGDDELDELLYVQLAGDIPTGDTPPEFPEQRPPTLSALNRVARAAARYFKVLDLVLGALPYLEERQAEIRASFDPPRSLQELQEAVSTPEKGYDVHHIVERATRNPNGSEDAMINAPDNLVRIPRWKHWELNAWYERPQDRFSGLSPRQYLRDKSWDERRAVGLEGLIEIGVLK